MVRTEEKPADLGIGQGLYILVQEGADGSQARTGEVVWRWGESRLTFMSYGANIEEKANCSPDSKKVKPVVGG